MLTVQIWSAEGCLSLSPLTTVPVVGICSRAEAGDSGANGETSQAASEGSDEKALSWGSGQRDILEISQALKFHNYEFSPSSTM